VDTPEINDASYLEDFDSIVDGVPIG